jgi:hypothetical protein
MHHTAKTSKMTNKTMFANPKIQSPTLYFLVHHTAKTQLVTPLHSKR